VAGPAIFNIGNSIGGSTTLPKIGASGIAA
jgi:hypothetical protein